MKGPLLGQVLARYAQALQMEVTATVGTRFFLELRTRLTPYEVMASRLPRAGKILDVGCGHGILSLVLVLDASERRVEGVDHDPARIRLARAAAEGLPNLAFREGNALAALGPGELDGISVIDVLHYFSASEQERILGELFRALKPGGILIFREVDPQGGLISGWNRFYEKIATATGFTRSEKASNLHFRSPEGWRQALAAAGFGPSSERCSHPLFADILFIGIKPEGSS